MNNYYGITYFSFLYKLIQFKWFRKFWRKYCCSRGVHLLDEVGHDGCPHYEHYLCCDCCQLMVYISEIDDNYVLKEEKNATYNI